MRATKFGEHCDLVHVDEAKLGLLVGVAFAIDVTQAYPHATRSLEPTFLLVKRVAVKGTLEAARRSGDDAVGDLCRVAVGNVDCSAWTIVVK